MYAKLLINLQSWIMCRHQTKRKFVLVCAELFHINGHGGRRLIVLLQGLGGECVLRTHVSCDIIVITIILNNV